MKRYEDFKVFTEVAKHLSLSEAARSNSTSTATVSRKIKSLETCLNVKLFNRNTRSVSLTKTGEELLPKVECSRNPRRRFDNAPIQRKQPVGIIRITAPALMINHLSEVLSEFFHEYPMIQFYFNVTEHQNLTKLNFDCAFRIGPMKDSELKAFKIAEVQYVLVGSLN